MSRTARLLLKGRAVLPGSDAEVRVRVYEAVDAALIRVTTFPEGREVPPWPDLTGDDVFCWRTWLRQVWTLNGFADAVQAASPELAAQVEQQITSPVPASRREVRRTRRLVETVARYLLRWSSRATPFGLFAGIAPVGFGTRAALSWGEDHRVVVRPDGRFVDELAERVEQRVEALRRVSVVTNSLGFARGGSWVVPGLGAGDRLWDVEVGLTRPVRLAVEAARQPIGFSDLAAKLAAETSSVELPVIEGMLADLVARRVLLSALRPPMTVTDPMAFLARHADIPDQLGRSAVDVRVDCSVTLPPAVLREAENAAFVLAQVAPEMPGWRAYHQAFLERYGPGAAVPVRELVRGSELGFPAGFRGSHRREPERLVPRDVALAKLAQTAALAGRTEVDLDDDLIARLTLGRREPVAHTELRFSLAAGTLGDLDRGAFTLTVIRGARHAGVTVGRFLHLLDDTESERFRRAYGALTTTMPEAIKVQISGPPLAPAMTAVARVPEILPILPLGEHREQHGISLDDLAVTGDAHRLWLVSLSHGRPVEPLVFNAVDLARGQQPLMRFLTEIWTAWSAPCCPFSWGSVARELQFLPRIRYGRSILHPARWTITATALPDRTTPWRDWRTAWERLRERYRLPEAVMLGADDVRIRLDLGEPAHLVLLRSRLDRQGEAILTETAGRPGWIKGRAHELVVPLTRTGPLAPPKHARPIRLVNTTQRRPGSSFWLYTQVYGRVEEIITHLADLAVEGEENWWFIRYHAPEPHLRLRIPLHVASHFGAAAARLGRWADRLHADGLLRDYTIHTYRPETRFGTGSTLAAAEKVFAADSHAVLQRLAGDRQAATAAGLIAIADDFTNGDGTRWLLEHVEHGGGPSLRHKKPGNIHPLNDERLQRTLKDYRILVDQDGLDPDRVLIDLLHLHHARMIGVDLASERLCLRLARAVAQSRLAQGTS